MHGTPESGVTPGHRRRFLRAAACRRGRGGRAIPNGDLRGDVAVPGAQKTSMMRGPCWVIVGQARKYSPNGLSVAKKTVENFITRLHRLYDQKKTAPNREAVLGDYWLRWVPARITKFSLLA